MLKKSEEVGAGKDAKGGMEPDGGGAIKSKTFDASMP